MDPEHGDPPPSATVNDGDHGPTGLQAPDRRSKPKRAATSAGSAVPARDDNPVASATTSTVLILERPITLKVTS
jgi:hypothetical protein